MNTARGRISRTGAPGESTWAQVHTMEQQLLAAERVAGWLKKHGASGIAEVLRTDVENVREMLETAGVRRLLGTAHERTRPMRRMTTRWYNGKRPWSNEDWKATVEFYQVRNRPFAKELYRIYRAGKDTAGEELVLSCEDS